MLQFVFSFVLLLSGPSHPRTLPYRWVYVSRSLRSDSDVEDIRRIVEKSARAGLNGMVLSAGLDRLTLQPQQYFRRLKEVDSVCRSVGIEIIPIIFSVGYGGSVLAHNRNLAAGLYVEDALYVAGNREARFVPDPYVELKNGGLEQWRSGRAAGFRFHDRPGEISFRDARVRRSGAASIRFESFGRFPHGHARLMQEVTVRPHRCYRFACWVRTEKLGPEGCFRLLVLAPDGRNLAPFRPSVAATTGSWKRVVLGFNSLDYDKVKVYAGVWGGRSGRFWLDDLSLQEVGLVNVLRRPGTPVSVRSEKTGRLYVEGRDFERIFDPHLNFRFDHEGPPLKLPRGSRIQPGERLRVSYYHGIAINRGQVSVCMSEPELYKIWRKEAQLLVRTLRPEKFLLSMDEIRAGGSCRACKARRLSMARILGACITKQVEILRKAQPGAEIFIWSDMLDPNHNAHDRYYLVEGDFSGSWRYVPKDLVIVCWYYDKRAASMKFFSEHGFRTLAGAYYDGDTLDNPRGWLEVIGKTRGACGIMYTTWRNKYELLEPFGRLVKDWLAGE